MRRILPHPILSVILLVLWLMLSQDVTAGSLIMGAVLAVAIPWYTSDFWPERPRIRSWGTLIKFMPVFLWDVLVANLRVAWLIVNVAHTLRPRWLVIPLDVQNPHGITTLANVISLTPGTVSAEVGADRKTLLVHALDVADPEEEIATIKQRYERPIMEIFE